MKRILRSSVTKTVAFLLIIACAVAFMALVWDIGDYIVNNESAYTGENEFVGSGGYYRMTNKLRQAMLEDTIEDAQSYLSQIEGAMYSLTDENGLSVDNLPVEEIKKLRFWFMASKTAEQTEQSETGFYLQDNVAVYEATTSGAVVIDKDSYKYAYEDSDGYYHDIGSHWPGGYTVYVGLSDDAYTNWEYEWNKSRGQILTSAYIAGGLLLLAAALWIYLLCVCGRKNGSDEVHRLLIDRAPIEITLIPSAVAVVLLVCGAAVAVPEGFNSEIIDIMLPLSILAAAAAVAIFTAVSQSVVRNMKNGTFISQVLCWRIIKWAWNTALRILKWLCEKLKAAFRGVKKTFSFLCGHKISLSVLVLFSVYSVFMAVFGATQDIILVIALFAVGGWFLYRYLVQLDKIKTGIFQLRNGNLDYKIEGCTTELLANAAEALNTVNDAVKLGVEREVKAQRMKSELITNVSHDLKTPLTSIISYADLLAGMELTPKEANDYAKIVKQKGDRLKKLTSDLFDISKAESGNETVNIERLDIALLLRQSLAELNNEIEKSRLTFVNTIPEKEIFVNADGKKLSRVFENLLVNALKYSMDGTRVYVDLAENQSNVCISVKNISAAPMNFDPSEITERFVRGDASRSTEGSGLGLAIAKSYASLCGGSLKISVDGDLFKATVAMKKAE